MISVETHVGVHSAAQRDMVLAKGIQQRLLHVKPRQAEAGALRHVRDFLAASMFVANGYSLPGNACLPHCLPDSHRLKRPSYVGRAKPDVATCTYMQFPIQGGS